MCGSGNRTEHYFTPSPKVASRPVLVTATVRGIPLRLWTDRGVFSYGKIDAASKLLAEATQIEPDARVLDWGAGYGLLGIVAAKLEPSCTATLVEVNERAADLARRNLAENAVDNAEVIAGQAPEMLGDRQFDAVISNPPLSRGRAAVEELIRDSCARLADGGTLWLVIHTRSGAKRYLKLLQQLFAQATTVNISGGYRILRACKQPHQKRR